MKPFHRGLALFVAFVGLLICGNPAHAQNPFAGAGGAVTSISWDTAPSGQPPSARIDTISSAYGITCMWETDTWSADWALRLYVKYYDSSGNLIQVNGSDAVIYDPYEVLGTGTGSVSYTQNGFTYAGGNRARSGKPAGTARIDAYYAWITTATDTPSGGGNPVEYNDITKTPTFHYALN